MKLMRFKSLFFIFSTLIILPGLFYLVTSGLKLGIDFTGGTLLEYELSSSAMQNEFTKDEIIKELQKYGTITPSSDNDYIIRSHPLETEELTKIKQELESKFGSINVRREEIVGPTIGKELEQKAMMAVVAACLMIVLYITFSFRKVPKPASSFRFGISTIVALIHDVLVVVGLFAVLGKYLNVEIDTLFVTALLTVIGFSVHDTIVVFDRIRENLPKHIGEKFETVADISITQTLARSLNTSLTVVLVLFALLLFGGETIRYFVVALLIGIISGTYSSIFNATALLTWWEERLGH